MGGLYFDPEDNTMNLTLVSKELSFGDSESPDPLAPTDASESGFSNFFNDQTLNAGITSGAGISFGAYAEAEWSGGARNVPPEGQGGPMGVLSYSAAAGIKTDITDLGEGVVGYARGNVTLDVGEAEWTPPRTETSEYPDEVFDADTGEWETVGTITEVIDIDGSHNFTGNPTTFSLDGYADTNSNYNGSLSVTQGFDLGETDVTGRAIVGVNNHDGTYAGVGAIAAHQIGDSDWSLYGQAQAVTTRENGFGGSVEAGVQGTLSLREGDGIFSSVPARVGVEQDFDGGSPTIKAQVSVIQF